MSELTDTLTELQHHINITNNRHFTCEYIQRLVNRAIEQAAPLEGKYAAALEVTHEQDVYIGDLKRERDAALAALERVRALPEKWRKRSPEYSGALDQCADELEAALAPEGEAK